MNCQINEFRSGSISELRVKESHLCFRLHKATLNSSRPTVFLNMNSINNYFQCYPLHLIHLLNHKTLTNYLINASHTAALALPNPLLLMHNVIHIAEDVDISLCFQLND